jgi:site-specific DNA-cytosine methylase
MKIKWAQIIPLIGGLPLGMRKVFNSDPEFVISFNGFQNNDKHFINYLRTQKYHPWKGDYITIDKCTNNIIPDTKQWNKEMNLSKKNIDVVGCVAPCAGLSSLSPTSKADSPVNDWMYKSAEFVLTEVRPKIFWGENSIFLSAQKGRPVADKLAKIGNENNYYFLIYSTENKLHGSPQKRPRTFYFYFRKDEFPTCPIIDKLPIELLRVEELLDCCQTNKIDNDPMDITIHREEILQDNPWYQYWWDYHKVKSHRELIEIMGPLDNETNQPSLVGKACFLHKENMEPLKEYFRAKKLDKVVKRIEHIDEKFKQNKGAWLRGPQIDRGFIPAFVSDQVIFFVHPRFPRYLTFREALSIMAMPMDFNMIGNLYASRNHIAQNVCMSTAEVFSKEIIKLLNHKTKTTRSTDDGGNKYYLIDHRKEDKFDMRDIK